jgi:putative transposase
MSKNRHLSKHILDGGWGRFIDLLQYKTQVVKGNPKYTSQTCNSCGVRSNADHNAANNILCRGAALVRERSARAQA